jgi:hypothetical protein
LVIGADDRWEWSRDLLADARCRRQDCSKCRPIFGGRADVQLGLHRDGTAFGLSEYEIVERRQVWWEVVVSFSALERPS